jgi:hypothetical protein
LRLSWYFDALGDQGDGHEEKYGEKTHVLPLERNYLMIDGGLDTFMRNRSSSRSLLLLDRSASESGTEAASPIPGRRRDRRRCLVLSVADTRGARRFQSRSSTCPIELGVGSTIHSAHAPFSELVR